MARYTSFLLVLLSAIALSHAFPANGESQVVVAQGSTSTIPPETEISEAPDTLQPRIISMDVETNVSARYATTLVTSKVANPSKKAKEVTFSIIIPETAFISKFSMELDGKVYDAYVKEKEEAKKEYQEAVSSGIGAAHVSLKARDSNHFTVSVNVEPMSKAIFRLIYEEFLSRKLGFYNIVMNINPGQLLDHLNVKVAINETSPISQILVPNLKSANEIDSDPSDNQNPYATHWISDDKLSAEIKFSPSKAEQVELMKIFKQKEVATTPSSILQDSSKEAEIEGINGQFVVHYDVNRTSNGEILVNDGYFVHFFAPENLKSLKKHVIFVLDVSGSMLGHKIVQLKEAMKSILDDLDKDDFFNIMEFNFKAKVYNLHDRSKDAIYRSFDATQDYYYFGEETEKDYKNPEVPPPPSKATPENIAIAKDIIDKLDAGGGTNIYDSVTTALKVSNYALDTISKKENNSQYPEPMIIFLTDGDATVGQTDSQKIMEAVRNSNNNKTSIFSLAFGEDADRNFLRKLSLQNKGFLRHIYEASDAAEQLKNFYKYIASPLLSNITYTYPKNQIDEESISKIDHNIYFCGTELVLIGKVKTAKFNESIIVSGVGFDGPIDFIPVSPVEKKKTQFWPLERIWAFNTIKQLLDKKDSLDDQSANNTKEITDKVLSIALKYSFVTPLTSLVVVKPNSSSAVDAEEVGAHKGYTNQHLFGYALPLSLSIPYQRRLTGVYGVVSLRKAAISRNNCDTLCRRGRVESMGYQVQYHGVKMSASAISNSFGISSDIVDGQMSISSPSMAIAYLNHPSAQESDTIDRFDNVPAQIGFPAPGLAYSPVGGVSFESYSSSADMMVNQHAVHYLTTTLRPRPPPPLPPRTTETAPHIIPEQPINDQLKNYDLESYPWVSAYVNSTSDTLTIPISESNAVSYKLINNQKNTTEQATGESQTCENSVSGGQGSCVYLTECKDLEKGFADLFTYLSFHCDANGYAGICCSTSIVVP